MKDKIVNTKNILCAIAVIVILIIIVLMLGKGDTQVPFEISKIQITSTANGNYTDDNETKNWNLNLYQNNDIYIDFGLIKNLDKIDKKNSTVKQIYLENFNVSASPTLGNIKYYKMSDKEDKAFEYIDENIITDKFELQVVENNASVKQNQVNNNNGQIVFSIVNTDIINHEYKDEEQLNFDGTLLNKAGINIEDITFKVSFDIVIVTNKNKIYKANIELELPYGDILEKGFEINDQVDVSKIKFDLVD